MASISARALQGTPTETTLRGRISHAAWFAASLGDEDTPSLSEAELRLLASSIRVVRVSPGSRLISAGETLDVLAMVRTGEIEVYWGTGPRRYVLEIFRGGDLVGEASCLSRRPSPVSARARGDTVLILLPSEALSWLLRSQPRLTYRLLLSMAERTARLQQRLVEIRRRDVRRQLVELILERTAAGTGTLRLPQSTIGQLVFGSRTTVNRILKELERNGAIRVGYRHIEVLDAAGLLRYMGDDRSAQ